MTTKRSSERPAERSHHTRKLQDRHLPFTGLALTVPISGLGWGILHWLLRNDPMQTALWAAGITAATSGLGLIAHAIGAKRRSVVRWHVTTSVLLSGAAGAVTVAIGCPRWWVILYVVVGLLLACSWMLYRIDALRHDPKESDDGDGLIEKLGLGGARFGKPDKHFAEDGAITRVEVPVRHTGGDTVSQLQSALPAIEAIVGAPRARSRAVPGETADRSNLVIITQDVLKGQLDWPGPSAPGACITEPLCTGIYEDQQPSLKYIAGNHPLAPNPASYGSMGMTRTGKTMNDQICAMEMATRRRVVIFWFDSVKGAQTVEPLRSIFDIVVADDVDSGDPKQFRAGMRALANLIKWRATQLGRAGYREWTPACFDDPRLRMPLLVAHFEEADVLCDIAGEEMTFLASKGLSAGVVTGYSLQRADGTSMPTGLRFNIGTWTCFGCGDDYSAGFALSDRTIAAGAHPEEWKQGKPGYYFREAIGIPMERAPVPAKGFLASAEVMAAHSAEWGPRMAALDAGSIAALGKWYKDTKQLMRGGSMPSPNGRTPQEPVRDFADDLTDAEAGLRAAREEAAQEIAEMRANGEIEPLEDAEADAIDPSVSVPAPPADPDEMSWADRDAAPTAEAAAEAFDQALREVAADPTLQDPERPGVAVFMVGTLVDRYQFRTRPWFSRRLTDCVDGRVTVPPGLILSRRDKPGQYEIARQTSDASR